MYPHKHPHAKSTNYCQIVYILEFKKLFILGALTLELRLFTIILFMIWPSHISWFLLFAYCTLVLPVVLSLEALVNSLTQRPRTKNPSAIKPLLTQSIIPWFILISFHCNPIWEVKYHFNRHCGTYMFLLNRKG